MSNAYSELTHPQCFHCVSLARKAQELHTALARFARLWPLVEAGIATAQARREACAVKLQPETIEALEGDGAPYMFSPDMRGVLLTYGDLRRAWELTQ